MSEKSNDFGGDSSQFEYTPVNGLHFKSNQHSEEPKDDISREVEQVLVSYPNSYSDSINANLSAGYTIQSINHVPLSAHSNPSETQLDGIDSENEKKEIIQTFHNAVETLNKEQGHNIVIGYAHPSSESIPIDQDYHRLGLAHMNQERLLSPKFNRSKNWSKEETALMLSGLVELTKNLPPQKRELMLRNNVIFDQIASNLQSKGYDRNSQACLVRWRNILRIYKTQRRIAIETGEEIKDNQYSTEIEQIYSNSPEDLCFGDNDNSPSINQQTENSDDNDPDQSNTPNPSSALNISDSFPVTPTSFSAKKSISSASKSKNQKVFSKSIRPSLVPKTPTTYSQTPQYDQNFQSSYLLPKTSGFPDQQGSRQIASIAPNSSISFQNGKTQSSALLDPSNNPAAAQAIGNKWVQMTPGSAVAATYNITNPQNIISTPSKSDILYQYSLPASLNSKKRKKNQLDVDSISKIETQIIKIFQLLAEQSDHYQRLSAEVRSIRESVNSHQEEISKLCTDIENKDLKRDELQLQVMNTVQALSNVIAEKKD
ncbi:hypothetical protein AYI68_g5272 [Smittium mucronatum]|uniref:Myb/SANT-like DNA-binding domain-containing protein n=1 Tax=Smittium mucronatum TaxID=133383 RepID=A0A1R0GUQ8_9FUNG|nr:hypothetical protein AYI68_g5272 [Smittium mucronatum]